MFLTKVIETNEEAEKTFSNLQEQKILCLFKQNQIQKPVSVSHTPPDDHISFSPVRDAGGIQSLFWSNAEEALYIKCTDKQNRFT